MSYWDTSALIKLYAAEPDSRTFLDLVVRSRRCLLTSEIARIELLSALERKEQGGDLVPGGASALFDRFLADVSAGRIATLPVGTDVLQEAADIVRKAYAGRPPVMVRTLDALHVATAVTARCGAVVATDLRLRAVAALAGLGTHP